MGQDIIELNGQKYSVSTGALVSSANHSKPKKRPITSIDGVISTGGVVQAKPEQLMPLTSISQSHKAAKRPDRQPAPHLVRKAQKSATLKRAGLPKPVGHIGASQLTGTEEVPSEVSKAKLAALVDKTRQSRAKSVSRSTLISKFGSAKKGGHELHRVVKKMQHLKVEMPIEESFEQIQETKVANRPKDIFEAAVEQSTSHEAKKLKKPRNMRLAKKLGLKTKTLNAIATGLAVLALVGFIGFQNLPNINYRMAASRAGVSSSYPGYIPSGFSYQSIKTSPGTLTINFKSNSDQRSFSVHQANSNWSSEVLLNDFVAAGRHSYQSYQELGKTIYIYDETNATWVDGGVWYRIEGDSKLNSDQLFKIANSL